MSIMGGLAVGSRVLGGVGKRRAAKDQKSAAKEGRDIAYSNIETQRAQNVETERRAERSVLAAEGEARLRSGATGSKITGQNTQNALTSMMAENKKQMDWLKLSNTSMLDTMKKEADYNYATGQAQADATNWSAIGDFGSAALIHNELFPTMTNPAASATTPVANPFTLNNPTGSFIKPNPTTARWS